MGENYDISQNMDVYRRIKRDEIVVLLNFYLIAYYGIEIFLISVP